jgi:tetratricopeptide (TPR) repeat protein
MVLRHITERFPLRRTGLAIIVSWFGLFFCLSSLEAASETVILKRIRSGRHATQARIVLELEGPRPLSIGPLSDQGFPVTFGILKSQLSPQVLKTKWPAPVSNISIEARDGGSVLWVGFRDVAVAVEQSVQAKGKTTYRLILDFAPQAGSSVIGTGQVGLPTPPEGESKTAAAQTGNTNGKPKPPPQGSDPPLSTDPMAIEPQGDPFAEGDALFAEHRENLAPAAAQILEKYRAALRTAPRSPRRLLAEYRSGLCHLLLGNAKKAEEFFKTILKEYSQHPMAPLAWSGLGQALSKSEAYMESIQALRTAINGLTEPSQIADAYYHLGRSLFRINAHKEALEALTKAIEIDPSSHVRWPELLRLAGEAYFIDQKYDKCASYLIWYLNLEKNVSEKDILLAKIGESLMYTGNGDLAKKFYIYVDKHFGESEGYIISKIRRAEYFERQNPPNKTAASAIYEELSQRSLSGPLGEFLTFKLATWERDRKKYPRALEWIDNGLRNSSTLKARDELIDLKVKVLLDYIKELYDQQDFAKTLELFQENEALLGPHMTPDNSQWIAASYAALKYHPAAAELYQSLYTRNGSKNEEWLLNAAKNYYRMGDMEHTLAACPALQGEAFQVEKTLLMGRAFYEQGKHKEAVNEFAKHIQKKGGIEQTDPDILFCHAESLMLSDKAGEALTFLEKLTSIPALAEGEPRIRIGLMQIRCHQKLKQNSQAIGVAEHLLTLSAQEDVKDQLNYELSRMYLETAQLQKATEKLTQLIQSSNGLFKSTAQQELGYLDLQRASPGKGSN